MEARPPAPFPTRRQPMRAADEKQGGDGAGQLICFVLGSVDRTGDAQSPYGHVLEPSLGRMRGDMDETILHTR